MIIGAYAAPRLERTPGVVDEVVAELTSMGLSEVYLLAKQCSVMTYPSRVAPSLPEAEERDSFGELVRACAAAGIRVHAWFKLYPESHAAPSPIVSEHPEILIVNSEGQSNLEEPAWKSAGQPILWACPGNEQYRSYLCDLMKEVATKYPISGIHLDFVRYPEEVPGRRYCYCEVCRKRFKDEYGYTLPSDSVVHNRYYVTILCENVARSVATFSDVARDLKVALSAYVFTDYTTAIEAVYQDWPSFSEHLSRVHPTLYEVSPSHAGRLVDRALRVTAPQCAVFPVVSPANHIWRGKLGGERWTPRIDADYVLNMLDSVVEAGADGVWFYLYEALFQRPSYDFSPRYSLAEDQRELLQRGLATRGLI